jgi:hypothetical protein
VEQRTIANIIADWRSDYEGIIPKGRNKEGFKAMCQLIQMIVDEGYGPEDISSTFTASLVIKAAVFQGPINAQNTKTKRDNWKSKVTDDWDLAVRKFLRSDIVKPVFAQEIPKPKLVVAPEPTLAQDADFDPDAELVKNPRPYSPPRKIEDIRPENRVDRSKIIELAPKEYPVNTELEDFIRADKANSDE